MERHWAPVECLTMKQAPHAGRVAQLVRAPASHAGGHRFESCRAHHSFQCFTAHIARRRLGLSTRMSTWRFRGAFTLPKDVTHVARMGETHPGAVPEARWLYPASDRSCASAR